MSRKAYTVPFKVAAGSGISTFGVGVYVVEDGGTAYAHGDFEGPQLRSWTQVAEGLPTPVNGFAYHQLGTHDNAGYHPAKVRISGGKLEVRAESGQFNADTSFSYPIV